MMPCPKCRIDMIYDEEKDFWKCPKCGGEFWEDVDKLDLQEHEQARVVPGTFYFLPHSTTPVLPPICEYIHGGGNRKAGRKRKPSRRYKAWTQRYMMI